MNADFSDPDSKAELSLIHRVYNRTIRPLALRLFGRQIASFGGVMVRHQAVTDRTTDIEYKPSMRRLIRSTVQPGDRVVDIAAGRGVFAVWAARKGATVDTYEAAENMVRWADETARLNRVEDRIDVHHNIVSSGGNYYGDTASAALISPNALPEADVLILDCEGAEIEILSGLNQRPRAIVVETHPQFDAPTSKVHDILRDIGYEPKEVLEMGRGLQDAILAVSLDEC